MLNGRIGSTLLLVQRQAIWFRSNCLSRRRLFRESLRILYFRRSLRAASAAFATNCRHAATMARKSIRGAQLGQSLLICAFD